MTMMPKDVALEYVRLSAAAFRGEGAGAGDLLAPDVRIHVPGDTPASGTFRGLAELGAHAVTLSPYIGPDPDFAIVVERVVAEGERVALLAKGRGEAKSGRPYNNHYMMVFTIREGKIVDLIELCDLDHILWSLYGRGAA